MLLSQPTPAQKALLVDGVFCSFNGLVCAAGANTLAPLMGLPSALPLVIVGMGVLLYGLSLLASYRNRQPRRWEVYTVIALNGVWVLASLVILLLNLFNLTTSGRWIVLILALLVELIAVWQWRTARKR